MRPTATLACTLILPLLIVSSTGCKSTPTKPPPTNTAFIQGQAKVLEVSDSLGYALLSVDGKSVYGYWSTEREVAQSTPMFTKDGPLAEPQTQVREPKVVEQKFPAKVGDTITFRGMKTGTEIYLTGVQLLSQ